MLLINNNTMHHPL
jgi:hypothetical protein